MTGFSRKEFSLRPMRESDLDQVRAWRNQPHIRRYMFTDHVIAPEEHRAWFARVRDSAQDHYLIFECRGEPVGVVSFTQHSPLHQRADWGFYLGAEDLPKGMGRILGFCSMEHAFGTLGIRKLRGEVLAFNARSLRLFLALGFREEGRFIAEFRRGDDYHDVIRFALLAEDWLKARERMESDLFGRGHS